MLKRKKPNIIAGVPTIFEALLHLPELDGFDMSFLIGMFSGGDSLSVELKNKIDRFLEEHNAGIQVREGYGLTECVTASCLTPKNTHKDGSIGLPFKDTVYAIVKPDTDEVLPNGEEGEIIMRGPSVMKGYLNNEFENQKALRRLPDGNIWLYTGDLGKMDDDGYVYFTAARFAKTRFHTMYGNIGV
jgi:long-chain acyl-CoA synthetase